MALRLTRIISGGQTGVDRAALDVAIARGVPHGGWCPRDRRAEDGRIPDRYALCELASPKYEARTGRNVLECDATAVLTIGEPRNGTALTVQLAKVYRTPCLVVDLDDPPAPSEVIAWLHKHRVAVLNVAGPRESTFPGIHDRAAAYFDAVLALAAAGG